MSYSIETKCFVCEYGPNNLMIYFSENMIFMNVFFGELGSTKIEQEQGYTMPSAFGKWWVNYLLFDSNVFNVDCTDIPDIHHTSYGKSHSDHGYNVNDDNDYNVDEVHKVSYCLSAEIGGYMGLCLGASILTVFELAELFWDYCSRWKKNTGKRRSNTQVQDLELGYKRDTLWSSDKGYVYAS